MQKLIRKIAKEDVRSYRQRTEGTVLIYSTNQKRATIKKPLTWKSDYVPIFVDLTDFVELNGADVLLETVKGSTPIPISVFGRIKVKKGEEKRFVQWALQYKINETGLEITKLTQIIAKKFGERISSIRKGQLEILEDQLHIIEEKVCAELFQIAGLEVEDISIELNLPVDGLPIDIKTGTFGIRLSDSEKIEDLKIDLNLIPVSGEELNAWLLKSKEEAIKESIISQATSFFGKKISLLDYMYHFESKALPGLRDSLNKLLKKKWKREIRLMRVDRPKLDYVKPPEELEIAHKCEIKIYNSRNNPIDLIVQHELGSV